MFNSIRNQKQLMVGTDLIAIQGIGGLGHLGIQFAKKRGYRVAAISTNDGKKEWALKLGADHFINTSKKPASEQLMALGGAKLVLATAPKAKSMLYLVNGLGANGRVLVVDAEADAIEVSPFFIIGNRGGVVGWPSGMATDSVDTCCTTLKA